MFIQNNGYIVLLVIAIRKLIKKTILLKIKSFIKFLKDYIILLHIFSYSHLQPR